MSFFCLWIPQFPAWVAEQSEPHLSDRAFIVCERGVVVAASPLALTAGVKVGMTSGRGQSACCDVQVLSRDRSREALAWEEVQQTLYGLTPKIEPVAPGHLYADVDSAKILPLLRAWNLQGGEGHDRASALLAAVTCEPRSMRGIKKGHETAFADRVPLEMLYPAGLSESSVERLKWFGYRWVGSVRILSRRQLDEQCPADSDLLFRLSQGPRCKDNLREVSTWTPAEELISRLSFHAPCTEPGEWEPALDLLLERVCNELGSRSAHTLEIIAETAINPVSARRVLRDAVSQPGQLTGPARHALVEALRTLSPLQPVVTALEVRLGGLVAAPVQASLWEGEAKAGDPVVKERRWRGAIENLDSRFKGKTSVLGRFVERNVHSPYPEDHFGWLPALEELAAQRQVKATR